MWSIIENQLTAKLPFVVYRKPHDKDVNAVFQSDNEINHVDDFTETGFVFAPFAPGKKVILLRDDDRLQFPFLPNEVVNNGSRIIERSGKVEEGYKELINDAIDEIKTGALAKVVLSRVLEVQHTHPPLELLKRILSTYPNAFCYLWYHPKVGMWLGATPEILLQLIGDRLTTMSLAGTMKYEGIKSPDWGKKERQEQELVTDYILSALQDKVVDIDKSDTETLRAGNLLHLRTKISGSLKHDHLREVVHALHPTPAICGFPKKRALNFILENEGYERQFYGGYLGELNLGHENSTAFYVNLRCMQKVGDKMKIYVGGGVTKDSDPTKEWLETVYKSETMLRVLSIEN